MDKELKKSAKEHEAWVRKIAREEALKVLREYKKELASRPAYDFKC